MIWDFRILYSKKDDLRANFQPIFLTLCKLHFFFSHFGHYHENVQISLHSILAHCNEMINVVKLHFWITTLKGKRQQSLVVTNQQWLSFGLWLFRSRI